MTSEHSETTAHHVVPAASPHISMLEHCNLCGHPKMLGVHVGPTGTQFALFCDRTEGCKSYPTQLVPLSFDLA